MSRLGQSLLPQKHQELNLRLLLKIPGSRCSQALQESFVCIQRSLMWPCKQFFWELKMSHCHPHSNTIRAELSQRIEQNRIEQNDFFIYPPEKNQRYYHSTIGFVIIQDYFYSILCYILVKTQIFLIFLETSLYLTTILL